MQSLSSEYGETVGLLIKDKNDTYKFIRDLIDWQETIKVIQYGRKQ